jgi:hypothetical protein
LAETLVDHQVLHGVVRDAEDHAQRLQAIIAAGDVAAATLRSGSIASRVPLVDAMVERIKLGHDQVEISVRSDKLLSALGATEALAAQPMIVTLACPATRVRRGHQVRLVIPAAGDASHVPANRDEKLVALVAEAHIARQLVLECPGQSLASIAMAANRCRTRLTKLVGLACLAPDIVRAIVEGRQPASLTSRSLLATELPLDWAAQRDALGFS